MQLVYAIFVVFTLEIGWITIDFISFVKAILVALVFNRLPNKTEVNKSKTIYFFQPRRSGRCGHLKRHSRWDRFTWKFFGNNPIVKFNFVNTQVDLRYSASIKQLKAIDFYRNSCSMHMETKFYCIPFFDALLNTT